MPPAGQFEHLGRLQNKVMLQSLRELLLFCRRSICIHGFIISKLNHWQKLCLVILVSINKSLEIYSYYTALFLAMPIGLEIKNCEKFLLYTKIVIKQESEL